MNLSTPIPKLKYEDYPIDIHLSIAQDGAYFVAEVWNGGYAKFPIELTIMDLAALNMYLQNQIAGFAIDNEKIESLSAAELQIQKEELAKLGNYAYNKIFGHPQAVAALEKIFSLSSNLSIQIASENFFIPWELIYPNNIGEPISYENFWGFKYVISRLIKKSSHGFYSPVIQITKSPSIALMTFQQLGAVKNKELPFFEKLEFDGDIILHKLRALNPEKKAYEFGEVRNILYRDIHIAHFACHGIFDPVYPNLSSIVLSDKFPISIMDFESNQLGVPSHPLVILNACETGNINPLYTSYFASVFIDHGARGVVATECSVPDDFAADFAKYFYSLLLDRNTLGESLFRTRKHFLETHKNPTGLLYSMYAKPSTIFLKA